MAMVEVEKVAVATVQVETGWAAAELQVMAQTLCCKRKMRLKSPTTATPYSSCWRY